MLEKPTYEELARRVKELEDEKLQFNEITEPFIKGGEWLSDKSNLKPGREASTPDVELGHDITERKMAELALLQNNDLLTSFIRHSPIYCYIKEVSPKRSLVIQASENYEEMIGIKGSQMIGKTMEELFPPEFAAKITADDWDVVSKGYLLKLDEDLNGRNFTTIKFPIVLGGKTLLAGYTIDITERKQAEEALRESERYLKAVLGASPVGIGLVVNRKLNWANKTMFSMVGYEQDILLGQSARILYPNEKEFERAGKLLYVGIEESGTGQAETRWVRKDGTVFDCIIRLTSLDPSDSTKGQIVSITDISELKKAEEEKINAQIIADEQKQLALVGQVAGKMAHDFNNILAIIMGNAQLALVNSKEAKTIKTLELIFNQTIRGQSLTRNLVAFARDQEPKQEFFRISEKIELVLNLIRKDLEGIELIKEDKSGVPDLLADPGMIEHALINLIQNSIHATSMNESPRIIVRTYSLNNKICFEIEDNGCGISKENLENIYEPSFTLKGSKDVTGSYQSGIKGTGYGMSNVKKYIEQHKGNISIESELGSGTKFTISLPVIKKELTIEEKIELREEIKHFEKYILLVEDETAISDVQYRILTSEPCNHKVDVAHNGQMAKDLFERNTYDFVSLDYVLPGGINGMDVYHHIRKTNQTVPVLFISGNIEFLESIKELKQKDTYIDHLSKPCQNKDYVNGINELLERTLAEQ